MTGWRLGYLVCSPELAELIAKVQEPIVSCAAAVSHTFELARRLVSEYGVAVAPGETRRGSRAWRGPAFGPPAPDPREALPGCG